MTFATPLGLLALLAIPAILAIHLFRRRFPVRPVAGLFLWQSARHTPVEGRRIDRLPVTASLILECVAALFLALVLAGARISPADIEQHLVVLLDDSASMAAVNARGESARDRAARRVLAEVERLGARARITIVLSGERPAVLAGPAAFAVEARSAMDAWRPAAPNHSLALGIRLARELAGPEGRLMILSDMTPRARGDEPAEALWVAVGEPQANVGILAADRNVSPERGHGTVSLTLGNYSDSAAHRRLTVTVGEKEVLARNLDVAPGASSLTLPLPPGSPTVRVALSDDALERDNSVTLAEPRYRIVGIQSRLGEGRGRDALLKALDSLAGVTRAEAPHLLFVDRGELEAPPAPGVWRVGFGRVPDNWRADGSAGDFIGPFVLEKRHPLLLGVTLGGVVWTGAEPLDAGVVHPLASAGDRTLLGIRSAAPPRSEPTLLFNLDLDRTNLIRSPDWPILISNVVEMRRQHLPGPERWNYRVGEWIRVRLGREPTGPLLYRCGPVERALAAGGELEFIAPAPGGPLQIVEGGNVLFEMGVNFLDEAETNLRAATTAEIGGLPETHGLRAEGGPASEPLFWVLLVLGGGAILANWCLLARARRLA